MLDKSIAIRLDELDIKKIVDTMKRVDTISNDMGERMESIVAEAAFEVDKEKAKMWEYILGKYNLSKDYDYILDVDNWIVYYNTDDKNVKKEVN